MRSRKNLYINRFLPLLLTCVFLFMTACLDLDRLNIYLTLDKDDLYSGKARLEFTNVHSTFDNDEERIREMNDFFSGYKTEADNIIKEMILFNTTVELKNKNEFSTDVVIIGEFKNLLGMLSPIIKDNNYKIEGSKNKLSLSLGNPFTESIETNLILQYPGKIVSNNSKSFDKKTGTMKWNMSKKGDREVRFAIESK